MKESPKSKALSKMKGEEKYEKVFGQRMKIGSKKHSIATANKKHFNDLSSYEK